MELTHFEALYPEDSRFSEIEKIFFFVKEGNSCQLIGLPGVGRGNLLGFLAYNRNIRIKHVGENQKWFHFVLTNFSEMRSRDLFTVTKFLFLSLVDSLRERGWVNEYELTNQIFKESLEMQDELVLFQGLKRTIDYLAIEKQLTVVFLFDRFEEYVPVLDSTFFSNLRVLRNRAKYRFSVVFSLNKPLEDLVEPALFAEFHEFLAGHTVYMQLTDTPGLMFRLGYIEKITEKKIDEKLKEQILKLTAGHVKLTRLAVEACLGEKSKSVILGSQQRLQNPDSGQARMTKENRDHTPRGTGAQNDKLTSFLLEQRTIQGGLKEIWRSFSPVEQLWILNKNRTEENKAIEAYMTDLHFIIDGRIQIPLFQAFVDRDLQNFSPQADNIVYDENTNAIRKGKLVLSDDLTAAEFRLLKYFLHNSEQVISRDTVIDVVWGDSKSTSGVTDQAVDQLVFRLRKKIEENPNQPTHLLTVKGRGFSFTP